MGMGHPPPEMPAIVDYGSAPEIFIDGLADYFEESGIVRSSFYANQRHPDGHSSRVIVLRLVCSVSTQRDMRTRILAITSGVAAGQVAAGNVVPH